MAQLKTHLLWCVSFWTIKTSDVLLAITAPHLPLLWMCFQKGDECVGKVTKGRTRDLCSPAASQQDWPLQLSLKELFYAHLLCLFCFFPYRCPLSFFLCINPFSAPPPPPCSLFASTPRCVYCPSCKEISWFFRAVVSSHLHTSHKHTVLKIHVQSMFN